MLRHRRKLLFAVLAAWIVVAGCGDGVDGGDGADDSDRADGGDRGGDRAGPSTSGDAGAEGGDRAAHQDRGPHEVGVEQLTLDHGRRVVVWYPATVRHR